MKIIQISDLHLFESKNDTLNFAETSVNTYQTFQTVSHYVKQENDTDLIIVTGDITQEPTKKNYQQTAELLQEFSLPIYCLAGNHDNPEYLQRFLNSDGIHSTDYIDKDNWRIIFLDTSKPERPDGHLSKAQLIQLDEFLKTDAHVLIAMHHHPIPIHSEWMDSIRLQQSEGFLNIIKQHSNIKAIIFGHIHQEFDETHNGIRYLGNISTCLQFNSRQTNISASELTPGYRKIKLNSDGSIKTSIHHTKKQ